MFNTEIIKQQIGKKIKIEYPEQKELYVIKIILEEIISSKQYKNDVKQNCYITLSNKNTSDDIIASRYTFHYSHTDSEGKYIFVNANYEFKIDPEPYFRTYNIH